MFKEPIRLTNTVTCGGCAAKLNPIDLYKALSIISANQDARLLSGFQKAEDASVIKIRSNLAIVFTTDFIAPILDDPYDFGRAAAANALSDIYALGCDPIIALNIVCFQEDLGISVLKHILAGGDYVCNEAKVIIGGGHTVRASELRYGLAVIGLIHPKKIISNTEGKPGDLLVITKPLGSGILAQANKNGKLPGILLKSLTNHLCSINAGGSHAMQRAHIRAATDISGFGLAGHLHQLCSASRCSAMINLNDLPLLPGVEEFIAKKTFSQALEKNKKYAMKYFKGQIPRSIRVPLLFDPQTSGGLLISVHKRNVNKLLIELKREGVSGVIIGELSKGHPGCWSVRC